MEDIQYIATIQYGLNKYIILPKVRNSTATEQLILVNRYMLIVAHWPLKKGHSLHLPRA